MSLYSKFLKTEMTETDLYNLVCCSIQGTELVCSYRQRSIKTIITILAFKAMAAM